MGAGTLWTKKKRKDREGGGPACLCELGREELGEEDLQEVGGHEDGDAPQDLQAGRVMITRVITQPQSPASDQRGGESLGGPQAQDPRPSATRPSAVFRSRQRQHSTAPSTALSASTLFTRRMVL